MLDYTELKDAGGLVPWPPMVDLPFIKVIKGDPIHSGRFDVGGFGVRTMVGEWSCTPGSFEYTYPGDELCIIVEGRIRLKDEDGKMHEYGAGDTFYTRKGEVAIWQVLETVRKVFLIHDPDADDFADQG